VRFTSETLKTRLIGRIDGLQTSPAPGIPAAPEIAAAPFAADEPEPPAIPGTAAAAPAPAMSMPAEASPAPPDPDRILLAIHQKLERLGGGIEHLTCRFDILQEAVRQQRSRTYLDLTHQRMRMAEMGDSLAARLAAMEGALVTRLDAGRTETRERESALLAKLDGAGSEAAPIMAGLQQELVALGGRIAAIETNLFDRLDEHSADIRLRQDDILERLAAALPELNARIAAVEAGLAARMDGYGADNRIRQEGIQAHLVAGLPGLDARIAAIETNLFDRLDEHSAGIRLRQDDILERLVAALPELNARIAAVEAGLAARMDGYGADNRVRQEGIQAKLEAGLPGLDARIAALEAALTARMDGYGADNRVRQEGIQAKLDSLLAEAASALTSLDAQVRELAGRIAAAETDLLARMDAYGAENRIRQEGLQTKLDTSIFEALARIAGFAMKVGEVAGRVAAAESHLLARIDAYGAEARQYRNDESGVRAKWQAAIAEAAGDFAQLHRELGEVSARVAAAESSLFARVDAYGLEIRTREEGIHSKMDAYMADLLLRHAGTQRAIRPPVLAGTDVLVVQMDDMVLAVPRKDWVVAAYYAFSGNPERGLTLCLQSILSPGMVAVDVGANIGVYTVCAARAVGNGGTVYSFEPDPETFHTLRQNVRANGLKNVELRPFALSDRSGEVPLYRIEGLSTWNNLFAGDADGAAVPVQAVTLDEAIPKTVRVDLIKMDAEGAEPFIWRGMKRLLADNPQLRIVLEFAPGHLLRAGASPKNFLRDIAGAGFAASRIDEKTGARQTFQLADLAPDATVNLLLERPGK
jgi:FkbM family methyltransferase